MEDKSGGMERLNDIISVELYYDWRRSEGYTYNINSELLDEEIINFIRYIIKRYREVQSGKEVDCRSD